MKSNKSLRIPNVFIPVGGTVVIAGIEYRCVKRPDVHWRDACSGCAFVGGSCPPKLQCTKFTRRDGLFVWFVKGGD